VSPRDTLKSLGQYQIFLKEAVLGAEKTYHVVPYSRHGSIQEQG